MLGFMRGAKPKEEEEDDPLVFQPIARPAGDGGAAAAVRTAAAAAAATPGRGSTGGPVMGGGQSPAISTKTVEMLLSRVQTASVAQDRREALSELSVIPKLGQHLHADNIAMLLHVLRMHMDDGEVVAGVLEIFVAVTEEPQGKGQPVVDPVLRGAFLHELMDASTFLTVLKCDGFWPKYHAVQVLTRLQEYDGSILQRQLIECNGITTLVDILNDGSNGGALRNEGLILLSSLTSTNTDIQSALAFNNCFESLFQIITEEGGATGDVIVKDCLMIIQNMLRSNKAVQSMFREMSCATQLVPLLLGQFEDTPLKLTSEIVHAAVSVLSSLIRGEDSNGESVVVRRALCHGGIPQGLCQVALSTQLDPFAAIEALRCLTALVKGSKQIADALLAININTTTAANKKETVSAVYGLLNIALSDRDNTKQSSAMSALVTLIEVGQLNAASFLTRGISATQAQGARGQCGQLLASAIFTPGASSVTSKYNGAWLLYHCVMVTAVGDQLLSLPMGDPAAGLTLLPFYVQHMQSVIQQRQTDLATLAALLRPLFAWLRYSGKAILIFLNDESYFNFFATWSAQTRDPLHVQLLCASVAVLTCAMCPAELPPTVRVSRNGLFEQLHSKVGARRYADIFYNVSTTTEWQHAPGSASAVPSPVIYDKPFITLVSELHDYVQTILQSMAAVSTPTAASPTQQKQPQAPAEQPAVAAEEAAAVASSGSTPKPTSSPPPQPTTTTTAVEPSVHVGGGDKKQPDMNGSSSVHQEVDRSPSPNTTATTTTSTSAPATGQHSPSSDVNVSAETNQGSIHQVVTPQPAVHTPQQQQGTPIAEALEMIRKLQEELAAKDEALKKAQRESEAAAASHQKELQRQVQAALSTSEQLSAQEVQSSRLSNRVSELESQVHEISHREEDNIADLRAQLEEARGEREELLILVAEIDEEKEMLRTQFDGLSTIKKGPMEEIEVTDSADNSILA